MNRVQISKQKASVLEIRLINLIFLLCLFPFFRIIPFIDAEVQPISGLIAGIYITLFSKKLNYKYISNLVLPYFISILIYLIVAVILSQYQAVNLDNSIESLAILITPIFTLMVLIEKLDLVSVTVFKVSLYAWFLLSFFQLYMPVVLNITGLSLLLKILIPRFSAEALSEWDRGVVAFSPEPSYGAYVILLFFTFSIFLRRNNAIKNSEFTSFIVMSCFMVYANQSATISSLLLSFLIPYIILNLIFNNKYRAITVIMICFSILTFALFLIFINIDMQEIRAFKILFDLASNVTEQGIQNTSVVEFAQSYGSTRAFGVSAGYQNLWQTYGLGSGLGGWGTYSLDSLSNTDLPLSAINLQYKLGNFKPYAYAALVAFDLGLPGIISLSSIFFRLIKRKINNPRKLSIYGLSCLITFVFICYFNSPTSMPVSWIFFILFMRDKEVNIDS